MATLSGCGGEASAGQHSATGGAVYSGGATASSGGATANGGAPSDAGPAPLSRCTENAPVPLTLELAQQVESQACYLHGALAVDFQNCSDSPPPPPPEGPPVDFNRVNAIGWVHDAPSLLPTYVTPELGGALCPGECERMQSDPTFYLEFMYGCVQ
ncbi:MAG: hypothetical protein QM756_24165 [Polyangiaceae bacterium]